MNDLEGCDAFTVDKVLELGARSLNNGASLRDFLMALALEAESLWAERDKELDNAMEVIGERDFTSTKRVDEVK